MTILKWLGTTAIVLTLGAAVAVAQTPQGSGPKRDESPPAQAPASKESDRPATERKGAADRTQQSEPRAGAKDERRQSEDSTPARDGKQPSQQTQDRERTPPSAKDAAKQIQDQKGRDQQPGDQKQQSQDHRERNPSGTTNAKQTEDQKARDSKQSADQKQQQKGVEQKKDSPGNQARQPTESQKQGDERPQPAQARQGQQPSGSSQTTETQRRDSTSVSATISDDQRTRVIDRLQRDGNARTNINIDVTIGARLPREVRGRPLPADILQIVPQYRGYEYTVVGEEIVIIEPGRREVVDVIRRSGSGNASLQDSSQRIVISNEQRETLRRSALRTSGSTQSSGALDANCLQLQAIPEELSRDNPQLSSYRMLRIGNQIVLIDPEQRKVVEVVD